jgi:hypothetical protein
VALRGFGGDGHDVQMSFTLLNWAHLYQRLRRRVRDDLYRSDAAVERIEATPHGTTLHLLSGAEGSERSGVFGMPDLTTMPTTATNDWMSAAFPGLAVTLPGV